MFINSYVMITFENGHEQKMSLIQILLHETKALLKQ